MTSQLRDAFIVHQSKSSPSVQRISIIGVFFIVCMSFFAKSDAAINQSQSFEQFETSTHGKIGIYVINTANGERIEYRANERFPMGCTSKIVGVGAVLAKSRDDITLLSKQIKYTKKDLVSWSPITEKHVNTGMSVSELCEAAIRYSDNAAMNLLVKKIGGLGQINAFAHTLHNATFRQDHGWPEEAYSGGSRNLNDSATPKDMVNTLKQLTFTKVLPQPQQEQLLSWLKNNTTGNARIRAGVPKNWVVGDKTGTGAIYGTTNDLGIIWPPKCAPIFIGIYYTSDDRTAVVRNDVIASATTLTISQLAKNDKCIRAAKRVVK